MSEGLCLVYMAATLRWNILSDKARTNGKREPSNKAVHNGMHSRGHELGTKSLKKLINTESTWK